MRTSFGVVASIAFLCVASGSAIAQSPSGTASRGFYIEGAGGVNWLSDTDGFYQLSPKHPFPNMQLPATTEYDTGWGIAGRLGYAWTSGLRVDGEISYRRNEVSKSKYVGTDGVVFFNQTDEGASDHAGQVAIMANAYYDFINSTGITPYIGGGIGVANVHGDFTSSFHVPTGQADHLSDGDWGFAAQAIGGVSIELSRNLSLVVDYRYFRAFDISLSEQQPVAPLLPDYAAVRLGSRGDFDNQAVMVGLRYSFGNSSPPPSLK